MWKTTDRYIQQVGGAAPEMGWAMLGIPQPYRWIPPEATCASATGHKLALIILEVTELRPGLHMALWLTFVFFLPSLVLLSLQKRLKAAEADSKLKQVYIPT